MTVVPAPVNEAMPQTPVDDLGFTGILCSVANYQLITTDVTSSDEAVTNAISEAQDDIASACNRTLLFGHYLENLYVYKDGYVYPSAIPIASVVNPSETFIQGAGIWVGFWLPLPEMPIWTGVMPPQSIVEYWGGYTDQTVPGRLQRLIAKVAWRYLNPVPLPGLPAGSHTANAGGASVSGTESLSTMGVRDPEIRRDIQAFTRREARAWG